MRVAMNLRKTCFIICTVFLFSFISVSYSHDRASQGADSVQNGPSIYDPFGPENSPDHNGRGSGGVLTPSPYEDIIQTYYTRISADYNGVQYMLDCPLQFSTGISSASYQTAFYGILFKVRSTGFKKSQYDPVLETTIPNYWFPFEASFDYSLDDTCFQAFKVRLHLESYPKSLGMAGIGVLVSEWNLLLARDLPMDRKWDIEFTWIQVAGGYIMPLSPRVGGVNVAICGAVDLLGFKHQNYNSDAKKFYGLKMGSIGWLAGVGWNAFSLFNISLYVGGEWSFSTGGLDFKTAKPVRADIGRNTLFLGLQGTGHYINIIGGIQKEWESLDYQKTVVSEKGLRYYLGVNYYIRR
jgi:hypothetical protein